jgi:hypothetical protein
LGGFVSEGVWLKWRRKVAIPVFARMAMRRTLAWILTLLITVPVAAEPWARFRGPNGTGIGEAPGVPASFTEKDYNWKITLPGGGHSSPVIEFLSLARMAKPRPVP